MFIALVILHIIVCFILIVVVLLQSGKGADLAGAFGGGGSQTALGSRGAATVLSKATTIAAVLFMFTSLGLALMSSRRTSAVLGSAPPVGQAAPAGQQPPATAPAPGPQAPSPAAPSAGPGTESAKPTAGQPVKAESPPAPPKK
jgi:preprotein translocase subunit SecG